MNRFDIDNMSSNIYSKLEKVYGGKFPQCVKKILTFSGFDTFPSLRQIDENVLHDIELFIDNNPSIKNSIDCCGKELYQSMENFKFLPGHKTIILNLPKYVADFEQHNSKDKKSKSIDSPSRAGRTAKILETSDQDMKKQLILNLVNYFLKQKRNSPQNQNVAEIITERNITKFEREQNTAIIKSEFSCPFCVKRIPVNFKDYWRSANITTHLKKHVEKDNDLAHLDSANLGANAA